MKALIFNSGLGSRLGELTRDRPKSMVRLGNGESVFHRQLRVLSEFGVREFVVTTGPFPEQLEAEASEFLRRGCSFEFVRNGDYASTNYIWSMHLAAPFVRGCECLVLHGDLVFDRGWARKALGSGLESWGAVNGSEPLPEKDFKARVADGAVREVSVGIFGDDCVSFQPFYKLSARSLGIWLDRVAGFVRAGRTGVYAEEAANEAFGEMGVAALSCAGHFVAEVDTPEDLERASACIRLLDFAQQPVYEAREGSLSLASGVAPGGADPAGGLSGMLRALGAKRPLLVAGRAFARSGLKARLEAAGVRCVPFSAYSPNPSYEEALEAVAAFRANGCDSVLSVGGGSAMDVGKCVKAFSGLSGDGGPESFVDGDPGYRSVPHVAFPATAGTGSESTRFAVCYVDGRKASVCADCLLPDVAVLDASLLSGLPEYQRKCTVLDALCQAIESHWSRASSRESRVHSAAAIPLLAGRAEAYLAGDAEAAADVMRAANLAGKAINLTTTTAAHAMSYKLTSLYGIPHGHAVAACMPCVWRVLVDACSAPRPEGMEGVKARLEEVAGLMAAGRSLERSDPSQGLLEFERICSSMELPGDWKPGGTGDLDLLAASVNPERLGNFPVELEPELIRSMYARILERGA